MSNVISRIIRIYDSQVKKNQIINFDHFFLPILEFNSNNVSNQFFFCFSGFFFISNSWKIFLFCFVFAFLNYRVPLFDLVLGVQMIIMDFECNLMSLSIVAHFIITTKWIPSFSIHFNVFSFRISCWMMITLIWLMYDLFLEIQNDIQKKWLEIILMEFLSFFLFFAEK